MTMTAKLGQGKESRERERERERTHTHHYVVLISMPFQRERVCVDQHSEFEVCVLCKCWCVLNRSKRTKSIWCALSHTLLRSFSLSLSLSSESRFASQSPRSTADSRLLCSCRLSFCLFVRSVFLVSVCQRVAMYITWLVQYPAGPISLSPF